MSAGRPGAVRLQLLVWIARVGPVTAEAIALRDGCSVVRARALLGAARRDGLLDRYALLSERPALYAITRAGLRACDVRGPAPPCPSPANAVHAAACAYVAAGLEHAFPDHHVVGEPELRRPEADGGLELSCTLAARSPARRQRWHRGDLALLASGRAALPVVVEVELTAKAPDRLEDICRGWARCRAVAGVLYVVGPGAERSVRRAVERAGAGTRIAVVPLAAIPGAGADWEPSSRDVRRPAAP